MTSTQVTIQQALEMDRLWQKAFKGGDKSATIEFFSFYDTCNSQAKKAMDTMREQDKIEKSKNYWKKIASGINAVSAFKAKTTFREGQVFYYGKLRPATD